MATSKSGFQLPLGTGAAALRKSGSLGSQGSSSFNSSSSSRLQTMGSGGSALLSAPPPPLPSAPPGQGRTGAGGGLPRASSGYHNPSSSNGASAPRPGGHEGPEKNRATLADNWRRTNTSDSASNGDNASDWRAGGSSAGTPRASGADGAVQQRSHTKSGFGASNWREPTNSGDAGGAGGERWGSSRQSSLQNGSLGRQESLSSVDGAQRWPNSNGNDRWTSSRQNSISRDEERWGNSGGNHFGYSNSMSSRGAQGVGSWNANGGSFRGDALSNSQPMSVEDDTECWIGYFVSKPTSMKDLRALLEDDEGWSVVSLRLKQDSTKNRGMGYAFVTFAKHEDAQQARMKSGSLMLYNNVLEIKANRSIPKRTQPMMTQGQTQPQRQSATKASITNELTRATTGQQLLSIVSQYYDQMDPMHTTTALFRLSKLLNKKAGFGFRDDPGWKSLIRLLQQQKAKFDPQGLSNAIIAFTTLQYDPGRDILKDLLARCLSKLDSFNALELCNILRSLSMLPNFANGLNVEELQVMALVNKLTGQIQAWGESPGRNVSLDGMNGMGSRSRSLNEGSDTTSANSTTVASMLSSLARLQMSLGESFAGPDPATLQKICSAVIVRLPEFRVQELSNTLHSLAVHRHHPGAQWMNTVCAALEESVAHLRSQHVANILYTFATLDVEVPSSTLSALEERAAIVDDHVEQGLSLKLWALMYFKRYTHVPRMWSESIARVQDIPSEGLVQLQQVWCLLNLEASHIQVEQPSEAVLKTLLHQRVLASRASRLQNEVGKLLRNMGLQFEEEAVLSLPGTKNQPACRVDFLVQRGHERVVIEVDGPKHYTSTSPHRMLGRTCLRNILIRSLGWKLGVVSVFDWRNAGSNAEMLVQHVVKAAA